MILDPLILFILISRAAWHNWSEIWSVASLLKLRIFFYITSLIFSQYSILDLPFWCSLRTLILEWVIGVVRVSLGFYWVSTWGVHVNISLVCFCLMYQADKFTLSDPIVRAGGNTCLDDVYVDISLLTCGLVCTLKVFPIWFVCNLLCLGWIPGLCLPLLLCLFSYLCCVS